ncbi:D-alanyl-D-alanine carboxypeptidase [Microbacterium sp. NPDC055903]
MSPHPSEPPGARTRRELRRRKAVPPSYDEVAGGGANRSAEDADAVPVGADAVPVGADAVAVGADAVAVGAASDALGSEALRSETASASAPIDEAEPPLTDAPVIDTEPDAAHASDGEDESDDPVASDAPDAGEDDRETGTGDDIDAPEALGPATGSATWADENSPATALLWLDPASVSADSLDADAETEVEKDVLADAPRRPRAGWLIPVGALAVLGIAYTTATLLWPLHELPPVIAAADLSVTPAAAATLSWPAEGSAAIRVGDAGMAASSSEAAPIASITKVVSAMLVLDRLPLQPGEQGPEYSFSWSDSSEYWSYLRDNQSALDVPVGGTLTEYQMLQGILLGSANNYIDRLAEEIWGSEDAFEEAAQAWLTSRGLDDIRIVTPAGRDDDNVATPEALTRLAEIALADPVFAEIVATASVELPGAGLVENTNGLLGDPGIVGLKTGTLGGGYNLLSAKDVAVGDETVRLYAAVLGQPDNDTRLAVSRTLYAEVEAALAALEPVVDAGTVVGEVTTVWGADVDIVSDADATVLLWNAAAPTADVSFDLDDTWAEGTEVGSLTVTGPADAVTVPVSLAEEIPAPSAWWRITHPLELFGIVD